MNPIQRTTLPALGLGLALASANPAQAVALLAGDILVTDRARSAVIHIDAFSGADTVVAAGNLLQRPEGLILTPAGEIFVADSKGSNDGSRVIRIDPVTGAQTLVANLSYDRVGDITLGTDGLLYVPGSSNPPTSSYAGVTQVDPATGQSSHYPGWNKFQHPTGVQAGPAGQIYVTDSAYKGGAVIAFYPSSSGTYETASDVYLASPDDLVILRNGDLAVLDGTAFGMYDPFLVSEGAVIGVDPSLPPSWGGGAYNNQTPISYYGRFDSPGAIALNAFGHLLIADGGQIFRIDPAAPHNNQGANQYPAYTTPFLVQPSGMAVVPGIRFRLPEPLLPPFKRILDWP